MEASAERACLATGYTNAGTLEFLLGEDGSFYFIELNARLQVEHPVTELVTGIDIVREQLRIAAGEPLSQTGRAPRSGHAIEIRINAEDPANGFAPSPGTITRLRAPGGPGVRLDTHVDTGSTIPPNYDSMIAKLIVWDADRPAAIARCLRALGELEVEGIATTRDFAAQVLRSDAFASGEYNTSLPRRACRRVGAARRTALFLLYQWDLTGQPLGTNYEGEIDEFARGLAEAVAANADELDARISAVSGDWPAKQLGTLERNILRIGVYELQEGTVPLEVAIDEAVTLAKRYASEDAGRLVNGILGTIAKEAAYERLDEQIDRLEQLRLKLEGCESLEQAVDLLAEFDAAAKDLIDSIDRAKRDADAHS